MEQERRPAAPASLSVFLIIALLATGTVLTRPLLKSPRPQPRSSSSALQDERSFHARLWEDPLAPAQTHYEHIKTKQKGSGNTPASNPDIRSFEDVPELDLAKKIYIMPVFIQGTPDSQAQEDRIRSRYAVVSALGVAGFKPVEGDVLSYFLWPISIAESQYSEDVVPYEWFENEKQFVFVSWVDETPYLQPGRDQYNKPVRQPLKKIDELLSYVSTRIASKFAKDKTPPIELQILGPTSSTALQYMSAELSAGNTSTLFTSPSFVRREMFTAWCTAPDKDLVDSGSDNAKDSESLHELFGKAHIAFSRFGTDTELVKAILHELRLRGADPGTSAKHHIVLVSESDTIYSRSLARIFKEECPEREDAVHTVGYLRGLDGRTIRGTPSGETDGNKKESGNGAANDLTWPLQGGELEEPTGTSQADYLRRLSGELVAIDRELRHGKEDAQITAIGVVGSDVYDKLLVLQALRSQFTNCIFFTTDLDAAYLTREEYSTTRNLVVAAHFGLELNDKLLQRGIPPFRSSYQCTLYYGTLRALRFGGLDEDIESKPRMFEIGRTGPFLLSPRNPDSWIQPQHSVARPRIFRKDVWGWTAALSLLLVAIPCLFNVNVRAWISGLMSNTGEFEEYGRSDTTADAWRKALPFLWVYSIVVALAAFLLMFALMDSFLDDGEPFSVLEGISVWPTEFIRLGTVFLAIYFLFAMNDRLATNRVKCEQRLEQQEKQEPTASQNSFPTNTKAPDKWTNRFYYLISGWFLDWSGGTRWKEGTLKDLWKIYEKRQHSFFKATRIVPLFAGYLLFYLALLALGADTYFRPYRGILSSFVDAGLQVVLTIGMLLVTVSALDATLMCCSFIRATHLRLNKTVDPPPPARNVLRVQLAADSTETVGVFIYYSFGIAMLSIIARNSAFDAYNWPGGVILLLAVVFLTNGVSLYLLQRAAANLRRSVRSELSDELLLSLARTPSPPANTVSAPAHAASPELLREAIRQIDGISTGAYRPLSENPLVRSMLIPLTGAGGVAILQLLLGF